MICESRIRTRIGTLIVGVLILISTDIYSQDQRIADSLISVYASKELNGEELLTILREITFKIADPVIQIDYSKRLLAEAENQNSSYYIQSAYLTLGGAYYQSGQIQQALEVLFKGAEISKENGFLEDLGSFYGQIANSYRVTGDIDNSFIYQKKALEIFKKIGNEIYIGAASLNIGYGYYKLEKLDSASKYYDISEPLFNKIGYKLGLAYIIGNKGLIYWKKGQIKEAENHLLKAVALIEPLNDVFAISDYLNNLGRIYLENGQIDKSIETTQKSLEMAKSADLKEQIRDASLLLSDLYEFAGIYKLAHFHHKQFVAYKDSIQSIETTQKMADLRTEFEVGQKQTEVDLLTAEKRTQRIITIAIGAFAFILIVLAAIIYKYYRSKAKINRILGEQKAELERLNSTKDKFFSIISHDLRSPVAGFNGISQMIKMMVQTKRTDQLLEMTEHIDSSVDQLSKLLDNLLNWAMQQQGHVPNVPEKLSLNEMADDLAKTLSTMAQGKSIELIADVPDNLELWCDKNTTMTILRNLVSNALKFTPEGGKVGIKATEENGTAKIEVYDTGVGMPQDKLKKLFQLQDKKSTYGTSGEKGLGLGLQLVHEFMEMNNGKIEVTSEEGKGTTFTLWLPLFETVGESVETHP